MTNFAELTREIKGEVYTPSDETAYNNELKACWNACLRSRRPLAFVIVREKGDVQKTVKFCVENKLEICVSAGRLTGMSIKDNAVVIDLSGMKKIQVDPKNKTVMVDGGCIVEDVDEALHKYGFVTPLGSFSKLGVTGMTLIGGQGFLAKHFGFSSDNVLEFDLVLATGESIKVSADENPELFWGMKGFGANFGVVTSLKFKVYQVPNEFVGGMMWYQTQFSRTKEVLQIFRDYLNETNDNCLSIYFFITILPTGPELIVRLLYSGSLQRGNEIVQDLVSLTRPTSSSCKPVEYHDFQKQGDHMMPSGMFKCGTAGNVMSEISDDVIDSVLSSLKDVGSNHFLEGSTLCFLEDFGGKNAEIGYDKSAFPFRKNARYWIGVNGSTRNAADVAAMKKWADDLQSNNAKFGLPLFHGGNAEEMWKKLKALKQQFDPDNVFHNSLFCLSP